jgi:hypothetical protein
MSALAQRCYRTAPPIAEVSRPTYVKPFDLVAIGANNGMWLAALDVPSRPPGRRRERVQCRLVGLPSAFRRGAAVVGRRAMCYK